MTSIYAIFADDKYSDMTVPVGPFASREAVDAHSQALALIAAGGDVVKEIIEVDGDPLADSRITGCELPLVSPEQDLADFADLHRVN